jgi:hypothetical protein
MGITATWADDTCTTLLMSFEGKWTWENLRAANEQAAAMAKSVPHVVHTINDLTHSGGVPNGALTEGRNMLNDMERVEGRVVVVQAGALVESLYSVFQKLYGKRAGFPETHFFQTLDEAYTYLGHHHTSSRLAS